MNSYLLRWLSVSLFSWTFYTVDSVTLVYWMKMESKDVMLVKVDMLAGIVKSKGSEYISNVHYTYYLNGKNDSCT